jgi:hypothetical protein
MRLGMSSLSFLSRLTGGLIVFAAKAGAFAGVAAKAG